MLTNVTDQPWSAEPDPGQQAGYPPPPFPPPYTGGPHYGSQYGPRYGIAGVGYDPSAPFGRHPVSGLPYSDKSKTLAGLLQLLAMFGIAGVGRMYAGHVGLGVAQLLVGWMTCGLGAVVWGLIDALLILTDKVSDPMGRPLRDGF